MKDSELPQIPQADPRRRFLARRQEIEGAIARVFDRGTFILGPEVAAFEAEFAALAGARHAIAVASGTDALRLALMALGIKPGDEVITVAMTFAATALAIEAVGARPALSTSIRTRAAWIPPRSPPQSARRRPRFCPCICTAIRRPCRRSARSRRATGSP